jgi:hypothetical protein
MTDTDTDTATAVVDAYFAMWNEEDADRRAGLIERAWAEDGSYRDPLLEAEGHAALSEMVATVHGHYPGHRFRRTSGIDAHHAHLRFAWELVGPDGAVTVGGLDVGELAPDGRLAHLTGFFGDLPEA